ncbi:HNH endonuclease signature motif containing protein [Amycolatopsis sp. cmx-11-32]|uniref:HNH endonuclease signature motif containing protein n=1 Tax=Amycolatopsis sp. cmx-11-32 TaxID=2785796 RepID=UPI0039E71603
MSGSSPATPASARSFSPVLGNRWTWDAPAVPPPPRQKHALKIRDGGCACPGCAIPVQRCTAHHLVFWRHRGETKTDNLVLLCTRHHRLIHKSEWKVQITQDGLPEFIAPTYLDPSGEPRRNTMHLRT